MLEFEAAGRGYQLIGHSHGGSVIWHALCQAVLRRKTLARLRSWTTVGTPFLHYRTSGVWSLAKIGSLVLALLRAPLLTLLEWVGVPVANQSARDIAPQLRDLLNFGEPVRVLTGGQAGNGGSGVDDLQAT